MGYFDTRHADGETQKHTAHAVDGSKDVVDKGVGEARQRGGATPHQGGGGRAGAGRCGDEGRVGAVEVAAALERDLHQGLDGGGLGAPDGREGLAGLEGIDPEEGADAEGEEGVDDDQVARQLEPAARGGGHGRDGQREGDEDEDGVDHARRQREALVQQVARRLLALGRRLVAHVLHHDREAEHDGTHEDEEEVGRDIGQEDFVCHFRRFRRYSRSDYRCMMVFFMVVAFGL